MSVLDRFNYNPFHVRQYGWEKFLFPVGVLYLHELLMNDGCDWFKWIYEQQVVLKQAWNELWGEVAASNYAENEQDFEKWQTWRVEYFNKLIFRDPLMRDTTQRWPWGMEFLRVFETGNYFQVSSFWYWFSKEVLLHCRVQYLVSSCNLGKRRNRM